MNELHDEMYDDELLDEALDHVWKTFYDNK